MSICVPVCVRTCILCTLDITVFFSYSYIDVLIHISTEIPFKVLSGKQNTTTNEKSKLEEIGMFYFLHKH